MTKIALFSNSMHSHKLKRNNNITYKRVNRELLPNPKLTRPFWNLRLGPRKHVRFPSMFTVDAQRHALQEGYFRTTQCDVWTDKHHLRRCQKVTWRLFYSPPFLWGYNSTLYFITQTDLLRHFLLGRGGKETTTTMRFAFQKAHPEAHNEWN